MNKKSNYLYKDLVKAQAKKRKRLYKRFLSIIENKKDVFFLTFTFSEKTLKKTAATTRLRYIKEFLNLQAETYILNIDYGKTTEREHYHAIATPKYNYFVYDEYKSGYIKGEILNAMERYKTLNKSPQDLAERLTIHATKNSTKDSRIIYSRKQRAKKGRKRRKKEEIIDFKTRAIANKIKHQRAAK